MYLLNPSIAVLSLLLFATFTFHYVSIKSACTSTIMGGVAGFTFHYVSIKSGLTKCVEPRITLFTFHYVSIKSHATDIPSINADNLHSTMYLLNPLPTTDRQQIV